MSNATDTKTGQPAEEKQLYKNISAVDQGIYVDNTELVMVRIGATVELAPTQAAKYGLFLKPLDEANALLKARRRERLEKLERDGEV